MGGGWLGGGWRAMPLPEWDPTPAPPGDRVDGRARAKWAPWSPSAKPNPIVQADGGGGSGTPSLGRGDGLSAAGTAAGPPPAHPTPTPRPPAGWPLAAALPPPHPRECMSAGGDTLACRPGGRRRGAPPGTLQGGRGTATRVAGSGGGRCFNGRGTPGGVLVSGLETPGESGESWGGRFAHHSNGNRRKRRPGEFGARWLFGREIGQLGLSGLLRFPGLRPQIRNYLRPICLRWFETFYHPHSSGTVSSSFGSATVKSLPLLLLRVCTPPKAAGISFSCKSARQQHRNTARQ